MAFEDHIFKILEIEGGFVDDPRDPGGATNFGICARSYPGVTIEDLTKEQATELYRRDFWNVIKGEELEAISARLACVLLDTAIHSGPMRAGRLLQVTLRSLGHDLAIDGVIGPRTLAAAQASDQQKLVAHCLAERAVFMSRLGSWQRYRRGWMRRLFLLE